MFGCKFKQIADSVEPEPDRFLGNLKKKAFICAFYLNCGILMISDNVHSVQGPAKHKNSKCSVKSCLPNAKKLRTLTITLHSYSMENEK